MQHSTDSRRVVSITSDYVNSPHFVRERPTHNYLPPIQRIEVETEESVVQQREEGRSTVNSQSSASRWINCKHLRGAESSYHNICKAKFDLLLVMFTILAVLISITTISLCLLIVFQGEMGAQSPNNGSTLTFTQPPTTTAFSVNRESILDSCQCTGKCCVVFQFGY